MAHSEMRAGNVPSTRALAAAMARIPTEVKTLRVRSDSAALKEVVMPEAGWWAKRSLDGPEAAKRFLLFYG